MRILTVSNVPLKKHLGSGYVIMGYAEGMSQRGHGVTLLEPRQYEWLPRLRCGRRLRMLLGYSAAALRALSRSSYDLVELWGVESWWVARRLAERPNRPVLIGRSNGLELHAEQEMARHGRDGRTLAGACFDRWQDRECAFRSVDGLTLVSQFERRYAEAWAYQTPERMLALENPLPNDWLGQRFKQNRRLVLGYFGSWRHQKGIELLASAVPNVLRAFPEWTLRLVGVGDLMIDSVFPPDLLHRVQVRPFVTDRTELQTLYCDTAVTIMPSTYESFGLVSAEALACGCTLVASPTGLAADLCPEVEAVIVPDRSPTTWTAALAGLLENEERRCRIGVGGWSRVQPLRWSDAVSELLEFYGRLMRRRKSPSIVQC